MGVDVAAQGRILLTLVGQLVGVEILGVTAQPLVPDGGYKVMKLIGVYLHAPYLHDGGVAASATALKAEEDGWFTVADPTQIGMVGTFMQGIKPYPAASLRMLVDRNLRSPMVEANRASSDLQRANVSGQGHEYWVDQQAGYEPQDQTDLINFLLSLDDDPVALPPSALFPVR